MANASVPISNLSLYYQDDIYVYLQSTIKKYFRPLFTFLSSHGWLISKHSLGNYVLSFSEFKKPSKKGYLSLSCFKTELLSAYLLDTINLSARYM